MLGDSASLLFKIKGDATDAIRAFKDTEQASDDLTTTTGTLSSALSGPLAAAGAVAAAGLVAITTAAIAGTRALFEMSKGAADFGSEIFDASEKTGLSAERLSAMKFAADQAGSSLEEVVGASAKFAKTIGEAANGSEKAQAKLDRLGVTSKDLDTALKQALATIVKLPEGTAQMTAAMDAFGKSGANLLPFIKSFDGDLDGLTKKAKELGVTINDEAAAAADEFGDQLDTLNAQFSAISNTIGLAFMPIFNDMAKGMSDWLTANSAQIKTWAQNAADAVQGVIISIQNLDRQTQESTGSSLAAWGRWSFGMIARLDPVANHLVQLINRMREVGAASRQIEGFAKGEVSPYLGALSTPTGGGGGGGGRSGKSDAERAREKAEREAEALARRDLAAQIRLEAANLRTVQQSFDAALDNLRNSLNAGTDIKAFQDAIAGATKQGVDNLLASLTHLEELERQQLKADATENERAVLRQEQEKRRHELRLEYEKEIKKLLDDAWEERLRRGEVEAEMEQEAFERRLEQAAQLEEALGGALGRTVNNEDVLPEEEDQGIFGAWGASWDEFFEKISEEAPTLGDLLGDLARMLQDAFVGVAQAIGQVIQQWVLYGKTGPAVMRQILAAALASIAAEAAVKAIMATAEGFFLLAVHDYEGAAWAFTAAAFYGSVAAVAAIAGRAVAGNSFRQQTAGAGAPANTGANRQGSRPEGGAYSSQEESTIEQGINRPAFAGEIKVKIGLDSDGVLQLLEQNASNNGRFRGLVLQVANG